MANRNITIDRQSKSIVSYNGSVPSLVPFYQSNTETFQIQVVDPSGDPFTKWTVVDYTGGTNLRFCLSSRATGVLDDADDYILAKTVEGGWTWSSIGKYWTGAVTFNTDEIEAFLGGSAEKTAILEINGVTGSIPITLFRADVLLRANIDEGSPTVPIITVPVRIQVPLVHGANGIVINSNIVSVTGLTWTSAPITVLVWIDKLTAGETILTPNLLYGTLSATGFSFEMNTTPDSINYRLNYIAFF